MANSLFNDFLTSNSTGLGFETLNVCVCIFSYLSQLNCHLIPMSSHSLYQGNENKENMFSLSYPINHKCQFDPFLLGLQI